MHNLRQLLELLNLLNLFNLNCFWLLAILFFRFVRLSIFLRLFSLFGLFSGLFIPFLLFSLRLGYLCYFTRIIDELKRFVGVAEVPVDKGCEDEDEILLLGCIQIADDVVLLLLAVLILSICFNNFFL